MGRARVAGAGQRVEGGHERVAGVVHVGRVHQRGAVAHPRQAAGMCALDQAADELGVMIGIANASADRLLDAARDSRAIAGKAGE